MEKLRCEVEDIYKWDLTSLYKNENEFNDAINKLNELNDKLVNFKE